MAKRLPLPKVGDLPKVVLFHRDHPTDPRVVLQVPNDDFTASETYLIRMDLQEHLAWFIHLPRERDLKESLSAAQHIRFDTRTGDIEEIPDIDEPTPLQRFVAKGRRQRQLQEASAGVPRFSFMRRKRPIPSSPFRQYLEGRGRLR